MSDINCYSLQVNVQSYRKNARCIHEINARSKLSSKYPQSFRWWLYVALSSINTYQNICDLLVKCHAQLTSFDVWLTVSQKYCVESRFLIVMSQTSARLTVERESSEIMEKWTINRACIFIVLIFLCSNTGRCLHEGEDGKTGLPVPIVLWHGMGEFYCALRLSLLQIIISLFPTSCKIFFTSVTFTRMWNFIANFQIC